jgi:serine/threonine protein kinase/WD40 repeat protein
MDERELFLHALKIPAAADRERFLSEACQDRPELRTRVLTLLDAFGDPGDFLESPHPGATVLAHRGQSESIESAGVVIADRYRLIERLGEGGMGSVWRAEQFDPVCRQVAIKLIRSDREGSKSILQRFATERQAIAMMDHPNIARLLDAGTSQGRPFFVMELVNGPSLTEFCDRERLPIAERLQLFIQVCAAVQHAHHKGVIHRDLKPGNILVETVDGKFVPRIIDFGVAKAVGGWRLPETLIDSTLPGVAGTPLYMAPEQAAWEAIDVDSRADVYSLGVVLYELVTGTTPLERSLVGQHVYEAVFHAIRSIDPPAPSRRLSSTTTKVRFAGDRQTDVLHLARTFRGDLDWIIMKALSKERERRYDTPAAFAEDLQRYLRHEPVQAGPPGALYRLRKLLVRHRRAAITAGLFVVLLVGGAISTALGFLEARDKSRVAEQAMLEAREHALTATRQEERAKELLRLSEESRRDADAHLQALKSSRRKLLIAHGFHALRNFDPLEALNWYTAALDGIDDVLYIDQLRVRFCVELCPRVASIYWTNGQHRRLVHDISSDRMSDSGASFATPDGIVDSASGALIYEWDPRHRLLASHLTRQKRLLVVQGRASIILTALDAAWSPQSPIHLASLKELWGRDLAVQFSDGGHRVLIGIGLNLRPFPSGTSLRILGEMRLYSSDGHEIWRLRLPIDEGNVESCRLSEDATRLTILTAIDQQKVVRVYSTGSGGQPVLIKSVREVVAAAVSPDGNRLAVLKPSGRVEVHSLTVDAILDCGGLSKKVATGGIAWRPDGMQIVAGGESSECLLLAPDGSGSTQNICSKSLLVSGRADRPIAFSADGTTMLLLHEDGACTVWKGDRWPVAVLTQRSPTQHVEISADGTRALTSSGEQTKVWDLPDSTQYFEDPQSVSNLRRWEGRGQWPPAGFTVLDTDLGVPLWVRNTSAQTSDRAGDGPPHANDNGLTIAARADGKRVAVRLPPPIDLDVARSIALAGTEMTISDSGLVQAADESEVRQAWHQLRSTGLNRGSSAD